MLASIHPLGERARGTNWTMTVSAYVLASAAGGALLGGVAGLVGAAVGLVVTPSTTTRAVALLGVVLVAAALDATRRGGALPGPRRQVNEDWLSRYRGVVYGAGFGFQLGLGVVTIVTTALVWALPVAALVIGSTGAGVLLGAVFGACRALPLLLTARVDSPRALVRLDASLRRWERAARVGAPCLAVVVTALALALLLAA